ncbi:MAG: response regulator [Halanaerobium sp. MSAO_Bac5]|nr:MAG: response regulator [Halanaerobium sp. MSAO_Bac5]
MANILIIDDAALIRKRIKNILFYDNHKVFELESAKTIRNNSFLEKFPLNKIDVIFLDIYLKEENGLDVLKYLTKNYPEIDVIIVSGENKISTVTTAVELGAKDFIAKPFDNQMLLKKLSKILEQQDKEGKEKGLNENLTKQLNSFNRDLNLELNRTLRSALALSLLKISFKNIDDKNTIIEIKNDITSSIRDIDRVYFLGHKELCFLLPLTDKEGRKVFRKKIEEIILKKENNKTNKDLLIHDITFPVDIKDDSSNLDFAEQKKYQKLIREKLEIE